MASFPNTLSSRTILARKSAVRPSRAVDGTLRYIDMGAEPWYQLDAVVEALTATERQTLIEWLDTNETADIDYDLVTTIYRGKLIPEVDVKWEVQGGNLYSVSFAAWVKAI